MTIKEELEVLKARIAELEKRPIVQYVPYYQYIQQPVYYPYCQPPYYGGLIGQATCDSSTIQGNI